MDTPKNIERLKVAMDAANGNKIKPPYFKKLENDFGITDIEGQEYVMSKVLERNDLTTQHGIEIIKKGDEYSIYDSYDSNEIYREDMNGAWEMFEYDAYEQQRFYQNSKGEIQDDRDIYPPYTYNANDQRELQRQVKSNRDIYPPYTADANSSLNESTEVKKIKDLMKRINII
jgi:hypothetical protein